MSVNHSDLKSLATSCILNTSPGRFTKSCPYLIVLLDTAGTDRSLIFISPPLSQSTTLEGLQHNTSYNISVAVQYMNGPGPFGQPVQNSTPVEGGGCGYCMYMSVLALRNIVVATCVTSVGMEYIYMVCAWCCILHFTRLLRLLFTLLLILFLRTHMHTHMLHITHSSICPTKC